LQALRGREIKAPWVPEIIDTSCFDDWNHLEDKIRQVYFSLSREDKELFKDFQRNPDEFSRLRSCRKVSAVHGNAQDTVGRTLLFTKHMNVWIYYVSPALEEYVK
jgi:hypothetical protein